MANYDDALKVMDAVAKYREDESLPDDPHEIDRLCERLFSDDGFDEVAIAWKRISKYEREVHGGDWPKADCENTGNKRGHSSDGSTGLKRGHSC